MTTQQPNWKCIGHVGDVDPIAHGGGFVYVDETGVYGPEMTWFEPAPDEEWHKTEGKTPLQVYRILLEPQPENEWWHERLPEVARSCGVTAADMLRPFGNGSLGRAFVYMNLIQHFGAEEFDQEPATTTEDEAYAKYAGEMELARQAA